MSDSAATARTTELELVGIFGGTFDPIHRGHLDTVSVVLEACNLDRVLFVPAATPPHRDLPGATAQQRLAQDLDQARGSGLDSPAQARATLARLKTLIDAHPAAALTAHGRLDGGTLQAAMARPTA